MKTTKYEFELISKIANRALDLYERHGINDTKLTTMMDIEGAHNDCPIDLAALLECDDATFSHDIGGIRRHMNRQTRKLEDCFVPRTALR